MITTNDLVLFENQVWEVRWVSGSSVQIKLQGVDFHHARSVLTSEVTPITKEVADCMLASDPPEVMVRYAEGWSDPRGIFN
jgi:hypothetical protein